MSDLLARILIRKPNVDESLAEEFIQTAKDRILLRVGLKGDLPKELKSICVEIVTAMINRHEMNHEGIDSERVDVFSVKFINNLLDEYDEEFQSFKEMVADEEDDKRRMVRFL